VQTSRQLELMKTLGDNTRYAIYLEIARASHPVSTTEVAETLGLHVNTVRPHLERMRDAGLLDVRTEQTGGVGRPHHLYSLAEDAPSLGLEPAAYPRLARLLVTAAAEHGNLEPDVSEAGRAQGATDAGAWPAEASGVEALTAELSRQGFDPAAASDDAGTVVAFTHCPYRALAEAHPELICGLHEGMVAGFVAARGDCRLVRFANLADRDPCRVELVS
jgi:predicted ArsR family transcriptional regulator